MLNTSAELSHAVKANTDVFMAFTKIAFSGIEQLTTLNLNTARSSLEECTAAAVSLLELNGAMPSSKVKKPTPFATGESAAAYFRSVQGIATEAQEEITKLMTAYFASQGNGSRQFTDWLKGFDKFNGYGQQFSEFAEANRKAMNDITSQVANQTNVYSRKSA